MLRLNNLKYNSKRSLSTAAKAYIEPTHPDKPIPKNIEQHLNRYSNSVLNTYARPPIMFTNGKGLSLFDSQGRQYLDLSAGIAVNSLGHSDEGVAKVLSNQANKLVHSSNLYHNEWSGELAHLLTTLTKSRGGLGYKKGSSSEGAGLKAFFANSGTEANEGALKFARKAGKELNKDKIDLVCFHNAFHGRSMGGLSVTPNKKYQDPFNPLIPNVRVGNVNDIPSLTTLINDNTCGVIIEPIQGEGGIFSVDVEFLKALRKRCDETRTILIYDEIQCGLFRTTEMWSHSDLPVECHPDIVTMAKPLANGFPIGAVLLRDNVANYVNPGSHGTTFGGSPLSTCVAHHVLTRLSELPNLKSNAELMKSKLNKLANDYSDIIKSEVRGKGFILGIPFKDESHPSKVLQLARERGLLVLVAGSDAIRIVPSLTINEDEINKACDILEAVFELIRKGN